MLLQRFSERINIQGEAARWLLNTAVVKEDARNEDASTYCAATIY